MQSKPVRITAIEKTRQVRDVKCLATSTSTFVANGFASHNCDKARQVGVEPLLDTSIQVGHEGWQIWKMEHLPAAQQMRKREALKEAIAQMPPKQLKYLKKAAREGTSSPLVLPLRRSS